MSINFPTSIDALTNPLSTDQVSTVSHSSQHSDVNDAIEALEAKVGVSSSAVVTSLDYLMRHLPTQEANVSFGDYNITNVGSISLDSIAADATDIDITLTDDSVTAMEIKESTNAYLTFVTTNSGEKITLGKKLEAGSVEIEGTNFDINGGTVDAITALTVANDVDIGSYELRAATFESDIATGTAPLIIASATVVANLNADAFDGIHAGTLNNGTLARYNSTGTKLESGTVTESSGALGAITTLSMSGQLTNTLAIGSAPFVITSTTLVSNLNADLWDGYQFSDYFDQAVKQASSPTLAGLVVSGLTASELVATNGSKALQSLAIATYPSLTEISYVKGVTSALQTQLGAKAPLTAPTFATSITGSYLTVSEILITDSSKNIISAPVATYPSLMELSYVKGLTSAIQTQLNAKAATLAGTINEIAYFNSASTIASLAVATYPSLTELSYVKGLSSAIQTQLGNKQAVHANLTSLAGLSYVSASFVKMTGANTFTLDTATYQPLDADLTAIAALSSADSNIIVGSATGWVAESGATARTSLGMGTGDTLQFNSLGIGAAPTARLYLEKDTSGGNFNGVIIDQSANSGYTVFTIKTRYNISGGGGNLLDIRHANGDAHLSVSDNGLVGIGTSTPSANADLTLFGGKLCLKETTTPTADTDYGKIYTKNDNKLYFQDGAGIEHEIAYV